MRKSFLITLCLLFFPWIAAQAQTTAFTYQGHLMDGGSSANGNYDIQFTLKNALTGGSTQGTPQVIAPVNAVNGIFTVSLQFGSVVLNGGDRYIELAVRPFGSTDAYTVLTPRQRITSVPYAIQSLNAGNASTAGFANVATNATNLTGTLTSANIPANLITSTMLANGAVSSAQLAAGAVGVTQLAPDTITTSGRLAQAGVVNEGDMTFVFNRASFSKSFAPAFPAAPVVTLSAQGGSGTPWFESAWVETASANSFSARLNIPVEQTKLPTTTVLFRMGATINGMPAVIEQLGSITNMSIKFHRLTNPATKTWTSYTARSAFYFYQVLSNLCDVNGAPAFIYSSQGFSGGPTGYTFIRAADANGTDWTNGSFGNVGTVGSGGTLVMVNGNPALCFDSGSGLVFKRAPNSDGSGTWSAGVTLDTGSCSSFNVITADGRPAIVYQRAGEIRYARASDANGDAWGAPVTLATGSGPGAAIFGSLPKVVYTAGGQVRLLTASDAQGTAWGAPIVLDAATDCTTAGIASIAGKLAIRYYRGSGSIPQLYYNQATNTAASQWDAPALVPTPVPSSTFSFGSLFVELGSQPYLSLSLNPDGTEYALSPAPLPASYKVNWIALPP